MLVHARNFGLWEGYLRSLSERHLFVCYACYILGACRPTPRAPILSFGRGQPTDRVFSVSVPVGRPQALLAL